MSRMVLAALAAAMAASGCASTEHMRAMQMPAPTASALVIFPTQNTFRDSVVLEYVTGVSQHSYVFAEPNGAVLRALVNRAMHNAGIAAGTPTRARYGLRVFVTEVSGPSVGADFRANVKATYVIVDRRTQAEVFRREVDTAGMSVFLAPNEGDLRTATQRSWPLIRANALAGAATASADLILDEADPELVDYEAWTEADWDSFWQAYSQLLLASALFGPVTVGAEIVNPWNFLPWADDEAAAQARGAPHRHEGRIGSDRAAYANYRASAASVTGFLTALVEEQGIELVPVLPCYGDRDVEAFKVALMSRGHTWRSDDCSIER